MYDQSVTCLADDPRNLEIQSNRRRTPGILSQTNKQAYNKYSSMKMQRKPNKNILTESLGQEHRFAKRIN